MNDRRGQRPTQINRPLVAPPRPPAPSTPSTSTAPSTQAPLSTSTAPSTTALSPSTQAPRAMLIERKDGPGLAAALAPGERYVLGRHDAADVVFDDDDVSRLHGVLTCTDGRWRYEDYGSANGSRIERGGVVVDVSAHVAVVVAVGDVLVVGGGKSRVRFLAALPASSKKQDESTEISEAAQGYAERLRLAARTRVPVFLLGASGVGKTYSARRIHDLSALPGPFVPINCARLPTEPTALHSELLGHVRGAYTGAEGTRTGKLVQADGGTLFLDEVESLPPIAQGFLLDVLEGSGDLAPLGAGSVRLKPLHFRLVSASKKPLAQSGLRGDLCERLAEGHLWRVPGLEERRADIPGLLAQFAREQSTLLGVDVVVSAAAVRFAQQVAWPGQIRMLRAAITALAQLGLARRLERGTRPGALEITDADLKAHLLDRGDVFGDLDDAVPQRGDARRLSRAQIEAALEACDGNQVKAAQKLGIARNTLRRRLSEED
jgi:DNA-binding NtrC family response regulator